MLDINKIVENLNNNEFWNKDEVAEAFCLAGIELRICTKCGKFMSKGYCFEQVLEYYCSDECLHKEMSEEEYQEYYEQDAGYYTDWNN